MPRFARLVVPGLPHHITQRGNDRQTVFFARRDRRVYLDLLGEQARLAGVSIQAFCLMTNHIHLVATPQGPDSLAVCLRRVHGRYAQYLNARRGRTGHLWQSRFYSCALEGAHVEAALRYVEFNPVRARMVAAPEQHEWSSASAHLSGRDTFRLIDMRYWEDCGGAAYWRQLLDKAEDEEAVAQLRKATYAGRPFGSEEFVNRCKGGMGLMAVAGAS